MTSKKKKIIWFFIIALGLLVIVRVILPYVVLHYLNKTLATMEGYYGHADDIDIALIRGAYTIDSIYLNKLDSTTEKQTPFFGASEIDLSVEWKALFHGSIVGELVFEDALLRFTKDKVEPKEIQSDSSSFKDLLDDFMPLQVNRVEINNGSIQYIDKTSKPPVDIQLSNAYLLAQNLRNSYDSSVVLPASLTAHANIYEGELALNVKLNPLADDPTFDMNAEIKNTNLVKLNDFFKAYAKIDVNKGRFGLYTEVAAKEGKFAGYVKPLIQDLDVLGKEDRKDNVLRKIWEGLAGTAGEIFENQGKDQVATKVPFEGNLKNPDTNVWYALSSILQNAFIRAIQPSIDQEINIATVDTQKDEKKNLLQKIFGKKDDKDKSKEEEKEKDKKKEDDKKDDNKDKKS
jgi:hypothetical protein